MLRSPESVASDAEYVGADFVVKELERVEAPAPDDFVRSYLGPRRPVILTGLTKGWLPPREWTLERMATRYGDARVVAATLSKGRLVDDSAGGVLFRHVLLREFAESLSLAGPAAHYVMAPTGNFPATLQKDYHVPTYCIGAAHLRAKIWLGKAGTVTPLHRDVPHNLHVHLTGRKRWLLFPPGRASHMYPRGLLSGMPNFSQVDPEQPDYDRHPGFRGVTGFSATLGCGETLFIPHGWWHHTRSLDNAVALNFWWGGKLIALAALASAAFKRARGLRQDEWA